MRRPPLPNYGEQRQVIMSEAHKYARIRTGSFSKVVSKNGAWQARGWEFCREYFLDISQGVRRMLFYHRKDKGYAIAAFINQVERKIGIYPRTILGPTQRKTMTWLRVSPWWTASAMRRSLFTALLRCGVNYSWQRDNFNHALDSILYTKSTNYAVRRFLRGYTKYTGRHRGWYSQFNFGGNAYLNHKPSPDEVKKLLIKPKT